MNTKNIFKTFFLCLSVISLSFTLNAQELTPLRLGVAGVSHGHLHEVLIRLERGPAENSTWSFAFDSSPQLISTVPFS